MISVFQRDCKIYDDYKNGMTYPDISKKYNISISQSIRCVNEMKRYENSKDFSKEVLEAIKDIHMTEPMRTPLPLMNILLSYRYHMDPMNRKMIDKDYILSMDEHAFLCLRNSGPKKTQLLVRLKDKLSEAKTAV